MSCQECNERKKQAPYREPADARKPATNTVLIEPSNPPFGCTVEDMIQFDLYCEAISGGKYPTEPEIVNTITRSSSFL